MSALELKNKKFGNLIAVEQVGKDKARNILWRCRCDCGREIIVKACELKRGHTKTLMDCIATSKSHITNEEWSRLCEGYKTITGEEYAI